MRPSLNEPINEPYDSTRSMSLTNGQLKNLSSIYKKERWVITILLFLLLLFITLDFFEDLSDGIDWMIISIDIVFGSLILVTLCYLWKNTPFSTRKYNSLLNQEILKKHKDSEAWKQKSSQLIEGLGAAINIQLQNWGLTQAEKEIALCLLKGYSLKDISILRQTGERTVRQQASSVYSKAQLTNRAELSAFFLEDILLPMKEHDHHG